jgi:integrase/recombinase XerD
MSNRVTPSRSSGTSIDEPGIPVERLATYTKHWITACQIAQHSDDTLTNKRLTIKLLLWFVQKRELTVLDTYGIRQFFAYCTTGHREPGGRWGNPRLTKQLTPGTIATYYRHLHAFCVWLGLEGLLDGNPMDRIPPPIDRPDQVEPFTPEQMDVLLKRATSGRNPLRDKAIALFLFDTGVRESELCGLRMEDVDIPGRSARVLGKGRKERTVYFGNVTARAMFAYLRNQKRIPQDHVFKGTRGPLQDSGLRQLVLRLGNDVDGRTKKIKNCYVSNCHPHRFRHTFAIQFLRAGGDRGTLQELLGHTDPKMTMRYVKFAEADLEQQHRRHSPVEGHFKRK